MNLAAQSFGGGRSSVLNPFTSSLSQNAAKLTKTIDGRRSVLPNMNYKSGSLNAMNSLIEETADEDNSSIASKNRVS